MLAVSLMGKFAIELDGKPVTISSRAAQSLLAYLILKAGTVHRREKLARIFWPDAPEEKARAYLRHELWRIRKAFSPAVYLFSSDIGIFFDSSGQYSVDAKMLERLGDAASVDELKSALSSYQGELLPGFYEDWIVPERERLQILFQQKMRRLLELLQNEKRWTEILEWAERWILFGQAPEAAFRALMVAYEALEDRAKVASTYDRCRQALQQLGLEPSQETQALAFKQVSSLSIPVPLNSFIGRKKELKEVIGLLSKSRLVTLTGVGGVGKTRLSIQVALEALGMYPDGIWFLDLSFLSEPAQIPTALAGLLGIRNAAHSKQSLLDLLRGYLRSRNALLIFDNCEHLIEACAQLANSFLQACQELRILATSREPLRIAGEVPYRVPSLEVPGSDMASTVDTLVDVEAVRLFVERAAAVSRSFVISPQNAVTIGQICRRLDGIPLAIELAAARIGTLSPEQIFARLDDLFDLLTYGLRNAPARHQTLRATIEWSYSLLSEPERLLFRRLAVFVGGWTLEAAEEVCAGGGIGAGDILDLLSQLVEKSLITTETTKPENRYPGEGSFRYRRFETIRQFAREKFIQSEEADIIRTRHLAYYLQLAEQAESALKGSAQSRWYARLAHERDNLRAALEWAERANVEAGLYLSAKLHRYWENFDLREGMRWLDRFLEKPAAKEYPLARAKALATQAWLRLWAQEFALAHRAALESLDLSRAHGDQYVEVDSLLALGISDQNTWNAGLKELYQQAYDLSKSLGDLWRQAQALVRLSWIDNDYPSRIAYLEQAVALFNEVGDAELATEQMIWLGNVEALYGNLPLAQKWLDEAIRTSQELNTRIVKADLRYLSGIIAFLHGDYGKARRDFEQAAVIQEELGHQWSLPWTYARLGYIALIEGDLISARQIFTNTVQMFQDDEFINGLVFTLEGIASLLLPLGEPEAAARLIGWATATRQKIGDTRPPFEQAEVDRNAALIMEKIGKTPFEEAYDEGGHMTVNEAVEYALQKL